MPPRWNPLRVRPSTTQGTAALYAKSLLNGAVFFSVFMVALPWLAHRLLPWSAPVPDFLRIWLCPLLFVGGIALWLWAIDSFSRRGGGTPFPLDAPRELVISGPFTRLRNPIIAGEVAVVWAIALYVASLGVLVYAVLATAAAQWIVTRVEEPELRKRFGESYEAYCRQVPRWRPRLGAPLNS